MRNFGIEEGKCLHVLNQLHEDAGQAICLIDMRQSNNVATLILIIDQYDESYLIGIHQYQ